ncbi:hypothetical protein [Legionella micdadei]|nr:hypothetical protein [Legionella micdadei]
MKMRDNMHQRQYQHQRASVANLKISSLNDIPKAEKILLSGISGGFLLMCLASPGLGFTCIAGTLASYLIKFKPEQDAKVKDYFSILNRNPNAFFFEGPAKEQIQKLAEEMGAGPNGTSQNYVLHNACCLSLV